MKKTTLTITSGFQTHKKILARVLNVNNWNTEHLHAIATDGEKKYIIAWEYINPKWFKVFNEDTKSPCGCNDNFSIKWKKKTRTEFLERHDEITENNHKIKQEYNKTEGIFEHLVRYDNNGQPYYERGKKIYA